METKVGRYEYLTSNASYDTRVRFPPDVSANLDRDPKRVSDLLSIPAVGRGRQRGRAGAGGPEGDGLVPPVDANHHGAGLLEHQHELGVCHGGGAHRHGRGGRRAAHHAHLRQLHRRRPALR
eukprot:259978-Prorocentrum_minimum.AAC.1